MLRFTLNVKNAEKLDFMLTGLIAKIQDWRGVWPSVAEYIRQTEAELFETQGAIGAHGRWAGLKAPYARAKERKWGQAPPLQASGRLRNALAGQSSERIVTREPLLLRWGTEVPYAVFHQIGTSKMVARPIFDFTAENHRAMGRTMQREAVGFSSRLGFALVSEPLPGVKLTGTEAIQVGLGRLSIPLSGGL